MRIIDQNMQMSSSYVSVKEKTVTENLDLRIDGNSNDAARGFIVQISDQARQLEAASRTNTDSSTEYYKPSDSDKMKIQLVEKIIEMLTGKKVKIKLPKIEKNCSKNEAAIMLERTSNRADNSNRAGWAVSYDYHETHYESEKVSFSAEGLIRTADGRDIEFSVDLNLSRELYHESSVHLRLGDAAKTDPLVINFEGNAADLTTTKFSFDLNSDGNAEMISFLQKGSGFLAIDKNADGNITNGSELFGPMMGAGFAELAAYDEDGNDWIDGNDSIFEKLQLWTKDEQGNDQLFALGQKGVGAIYLGHIQTSFEYKEGINKTSGELAETGVYVKEDGSVGTVQQINLVV